MRAADVRLAFVLLVVALLAPWLSRSSATGRIRLNSSDGSVAWQVPRTISPAHPAEDSPRFEPPATEIEDVEKVGHGFYPRSPNLIETSPDLGSRLHGLPHPGTHPAYSLLTACMRC